ncbi:MAG TPA: DUF3224 domain-containing protein [Gemmatimonadales bacterium]|nr:DUF3224 domain-containing protein [Gemmatimonadales bacterium]
MHRLCTRLAHGVTLAHLSLAPQPAAAQVSDRAASPRSEAAMIARGTFDVKLTPFPADSAMGAAAGAAIGRMAIAKTFHGDLTGTSVGEMLASMSPVQGSAGYVAFEQVTGTLGGKTGSFVLQHSGSMNRGAQSLTIAVVPDSGTGELVGLAGTMTIRITDGRHDYELEYILDGGAR